MGRITVYTCPLCGGREVYRKLWVGMNCPADTLQTLDDEDVWCDRCGQPVPYAVEEEEE